MTDKEVTETLQRMLAEGQTAHREALRKARRDVEQALMRHEPHVCAELLRKLAEEYSRCEGCRQPFSVVANPRSESDRSLCDACEASYLASERRAS